jgi:hypothetical protein
MSKIIIGVMGAGEQATQTDCDKQIILLSDDLLSQTFFTHLAEDQVFVAKNVEEAIARTSAIVTKDAL